MESAIYRGSIRHRRQTPGSHQFKYQVFMMYLDLAELEHVFDDSMLWSSGRPSLAWMRRQDYLSGEGSLDTEVRDRVAAQTGKRPTGPIRVLTNLRYFGYIINPITIFYCFDTDGQRLQALLLEVTNTPWHESSVYVLGCDPAHRKQRIGFDKTLHVSPFMPMDMHYHWYSNTPDKRLNVHLENHDGMGKVFDATLALERVEITGSSLRKTLLQHPFMTLKVVAGIYWQAARLYFGQRARFYSHPTNTAQENQA